MKRPYETWEDITHYDIEGAQNTEGVLDSKHFRKVAADLIYTLDLKNCDHRDILLVKDVFKMGYIAAHVDIKRDEMRDAHPDCFNQPYYRDEE